MKKKSWRRGRGSGRYQGAQHREHDTHGPVPRAPAKVMASTVEHHRHQSHMQWWLVDVAFQAQHSSVLWWSRQYFPTSCEVSVVCEKWVWVCFAGWVWGSLKTSSRDHISLSSVFWRLERGGREGLRCRTEVPGQRGGRCLKQDGKRPARGGRSESDSRSDQRCVNSSVSWMIRGSMMKKARSGAKREH